MSACRQGGRPSGSERGPSEVGTFVMGESVEEPEEKETGSHLCLVPCPRCKAAGSKGGACHLRDGHAERQRVQRDRGRGALLEVRDELE